MGFRALGGLVEGSLCVSGAFCPYPVRGVSLPSPLCSYPVRSVSLRVASGCCLPLSCSARVVSWCSLPLSCLQRVVSWGSLPLSGLQHVVSWCSVPLSFFAYVLAVSKKRPREQKGTQGSAIKGSGDSISSVFEMMCLYRDYSASMDNMKLRELLQKPGGPSPSEMGRTLETVIASS